MPEDIDAEAVDAQVKPEAHCGMHCGADLRIAPIEIGLFPQEGVVVVLVRPLIPFPRAAAEIADPIVGWRAVGPSIAPNVPVALAARARSATVDEPRMLIGCVVWNEIQSDFDPAPMRLAKKPDEAWQVSESRGDVAIVRDVIAEIGHRRRIDR